MKTFYFDTGVRYADFPYLCKGQKLSPNGVKVIPFDADAPDHATFMFSCDFPDLPESKNKDVIVCELFNTTLLSKYGYFRV
jgi:hypothetical protein